MEKLKKEETVHESVVAATEGQPPANECTQIITSYDEKINTANTVEDVGYVNGCKWYDGRNIDEVSFCEEFLVEMPLKCIKGTFFGIDGMKNEKEIEKEIYKRIKKVTTRRISQKVRQLMDVLKMECFAEELPVQLDRINLANGTYFIEGNFIEQKDFCLNRLPVAYNPDATAPKVWISFLTELLETEDILTLQEYIGYCLIPSNKAQKMLLIIGKGGEGKSRIGLIMRSLLGANMNIGSVQKVEHNQFARADLEHRLLLVDDDMKVEALKDSGYIKSIVTLEDKMDLERKSKQSEQGLLFVRFMCFGNGSLASLHDHSHGFYRRQLILSPKEIPEGREDDPYLIDKLKDEAEGILLWAIEGLHRLLNNNYQFTISERTAANLHDAMSNANNIIPFLSSEGYIQFGSNMMITSKALYDIYKTWCEDNAEKALEAKVFSSYLIDNLSDYNLKYSTNIPTFNAKKARGFIGIAICR